MDAIARGVFVRLPEPGIRYAAFVDMSGGSSDDAVLAIGHTDADGRAVLDIVENQGAAVSFNPNKAVERFVRTLKQHGIVRVTGDRYAGETFRAQFADASIADSIADLPKSALYEALEPVLNAGRVVLDGPTLEQQLLGLVWRGGRIDHQPGEHDDYANAVAGVARLLSARRTDAQAIARMCLSIGEDEPRAAMLQSGLPMASDGCAQP